MKWRRRHSQSRVIELDNSVMTGYIMELGSRHQRYVSSLNTKGTRWEVAKMY